jgi:hypothetical protein
MTQRTITCPSGLIVSVRGLKTKEANVLADEGAVRKGTTFDTVLASCLLLVEHPGPYPGVEPGAKRLDWQRALVADRFVAIMGLRIATYGSPYDFDVQCSGRLCRKMFPWSVDLIENYPVKMIPDASLEQYIAGNKLTSDFLGREVTFRLLTGADEKALGSKLSKSKVLTDSLAARITAVSGIEGNDRVKWLDDLEMEDTQELIRILDESDGGIDTETHVECEHCGLIQEIQLPFDKAFWLPQKKKPAA